MGRGLSICSFRVSVDVVGQEELDCLLLAEEVAEVGDCVLRITDKLGLGLASV